jgi:glycosyltransferase involved in cell wall biosynthesis
VTFAGRQPRTDAVIAAMDLLVLPSTREAFGTVLAEAGALGVPVVAAASRGAVECVVPGETGLLVPKGDPAALAAAILRLLRDPAFARRLGAAAARRARERWGRERALATMLDVYDRILAERASRA